MPRSLAQNIKAGRDKIGGVRAAPGRHQYLCSGTLHMRMKVCSKPGCRCAQDPQARHGLYYEWGHMIGGKLVHRMVTPAQAELLQHARSTTTAVPSSLCVSGRSRPGVSSTWKYRANLDLPATGKLRANASGDLRKVSRQHRLRAFQSLALALLVNAEHQRVFRGFRYRPTTSRSFSMNSGSVPEFEALHAVRLELEGIEVTRDGGLTDSGFGGKAARAPVCCAVRRFGVQSLRDQLCHSFVIDRARPPWSKLVIQPWEPIPAHTARATC